MRAVVAINPMQVGHVWPAAEPLVEAALASGDGGYTAADVLRQVRDRMAVLWLGYAGGAVEMAAVTEAVQRPQKKVARVMTLGGRNLRAWLRAGMPTLDAWARAEGCEAWEMQTKRDGFARVLRDWTPIGVVMRRSL